MYLNFMDLDIAEFAVQYALSLGAKYADARLETIKTNEFLLKNGIPQMAGFDRVQGLGVRINAGGLGFMSTNDLSKDKIKQLVEKSFRLAKASSRISDSTEMSEEKTEEADYEVRQKIKLDDISPSDKLNVLLEIEKAIKSTGLDVPGRFLSLSDMQSEKYY